MEAALNHAYENFEVSLEELKSSSELTKKEKAAKVASQIDMLCLTTEGLKYLYDKSLDLESAGIFAGTVWEHPHKLTPSLVKGTLKSGHPSSSFEIMSELRLLAHSKGQGRDEELQQEATSLLEEVLMHNLEFALNDISEDTRAVMVDREIQKASNLFRFLIDEINLEGVYQKLAEEVELICYQRPVVTGKARELIRLIDKQFDTSGDSEIDQSIRLYINAINAPTDGATIHSDLNVYKTFIESATINDLEAECTSLGQYMEKTGLVSAYHAIVLVHITKNHPDLVPKCLALNERGIAEWSKFKELVSTLILEIVSVDNYQCIYGLARMLGRNLFSRRPVRVGIDNLRKIKVNSQVEERILKSVGNPEGSATALQYILGGTISVLGQPLGVGQGNNPTCQSARGISMWSQHAPAKLIDMIITVATQNNLIMRFENHDLESNRLEKGLVQNLDHNLDIVSVVLVPHLDRIYNEMMRRSMGRTDDPHRWVNPAMYGHWIQVGFASCYDHLTNSILDFNGFVRVFYAAFHPQYNDSRQIVYPNPVGIFITNNHGDMLGFHAVSLLRVEQDGDQEIRAYFLNPNNEGRQDWGQNIKPSVYGHGEKAGESSLPFHEFAARVYAFHYSPLDVNAHLHLVRQEDIELVKALAQSSWGKSYQWSEQTKLW